MSELKYDGICRCHRQLRSCAYGTLPLPMTSKIQKVAERLGAALDEALSEIDINVLIMGPALPPKGAPATPAAHLRQELLLRCEIYGAPVAPEHPELTEKAKKLGDDFDLCTYETHLVNGSDLVILIPSSPGSFCELGWFGMQTAACTKMILLCDAAHPRNGSYLAEGPIRAAEQRRAIVKHVDYTDVGSCWDIVRRQIEHLRARRSLPGLEE